MKTRILYLTITAVTAIASFVFVPNVKASQPLPTVSTQFNNSFAFFRTHRQGKGVTATWGMAVNDGIVNFTLQRTYEDPTDPYANWEDAGVVNCTPGRSFSFTDKNVFAGTIHYRLIALKQDSSIEMSELSSLRIVSRN